MNGNLALDFVRVTELGAIASAKWIGRGDGKAADQDAVDAMRTAFNKMNFNGVVVIGEGAKDEAAELYIGEKVGTGEGPLYEIAIDPLECTSSVANGRSHAMSVIATGPEGSLYHAADSYMEKIATNRLAKGAIDLDAPVKDNVIKVAKALGKDVSEITVAMLDRPRHEGLMKEVRAAGARVQLFSDGDVAMAIATCLRDSPVDILMNTGGSTEAVLAAAALRCFDGEILCRWKPKDEKHKARLAEAGITDYSQIMTAEDLAKGNDISFTATSVLTGPLGDGVVFEGDRIITSSVVMSLNPHTIRFIKTRHTR
jgi:fructose-1,6-bisphosphatase II